MAVWIMQIKMANSQPGLTAHTQAESAEMIHASMGIRQSDSIKVAVRVRPPNAKEQASKEYASCISVAEVR